MRRPRLRQFSLRFLVVLVSLFAIWFARIAYLVRVQQQAAQIVLSYPYGVVKYDWEGRGETEPTGPAWLRQLFGPDYFQSIVSVQMSQGNVTESEFDAITKVSTLQEIVAGGFPISDVAFGRIVALRDLKRIVLYNTSINDKQLLQLATMGLSSLNVHGAHVSKAGFDQFHEITNCKKSYLTRNIRYAAEWMRVFDADKDQRLSRSEWETIPMERFPVKPQWVDFNGDDHVDVVEYANWVDTVPKY